MINNANYEVLIDKDVPDVNSRGYLLKHKKTGARISILSNDDDNKVFYIGFRTPPEDSTGVAHIMEHSVLCGSERYPLKDPFIELAKGSMNTFLNAMTYPDKTVYPVASCNDKDFANLMSVYMDAVFHPNIYKHSEIFRQEGWNYNLESPDDDITYNGVVFNEMKGAYSSCEGFLEREIMSSLFPDTAYGFESGGEPNFIPDLTYEQFLNFHRKFYHPSNSFIFLYGNMDIEERLDWMDREYLSKYDYADIDSHIDRQEPFGELKTLELEYPISDDEEEKDNAYMSYNIVCGDISNPEECLAMQMLVYALADTQGAPIRQRLLDEDVCKDVIPGYDSGIMQPYLFIEAKNSNLYDKDRFIEIIRDELRKAANGALNRKSLLASLNQIKFRFREADYGSEPKGLIYGLTMLDSWIFNEDKPFLSIEINDILDDLGNKIDSGYFEQLIAEKLLGSTHTSFVVLKPRKELTAIKEKELAEKLAAYKASLSPEEIEQMVADTKELAAYQEEEPTSEELECIPLLDVSDISPLPQPYNNKSRFSAGIPVIQHDYNTSRIAYVSLLFDSNMVTKEELPYMGLLKSVISFVDTENYTFAELNDEINITTGSFGAGCGVYCVDYADRSKYSLLTDLTFKAFYENLDKSFDLIEEALFSGKYDDYKRLYEIIVELKSKSRTYLEFSGHAAAYMRAMSYFSETGHLKEILGGIEFYKFIENLEKNFDNEKEKLSETLKSILAKILTSDNIIISCTADDEGTGILEKRLGRFRERLNEFAASNGRGETSFQPPVRERTFDFKGKGFELKQLNEAFKTLGTVNFVARAGKYIDSVDEYTGAVNVLRSIMGFEYLWFNIRVQGGAYGCLNRSNLDGDTFFATFRDPHIARSNEVFEGVPEYLENFDVDEREMTKFVIGTMSEADIPLTPRGKGSRDIINYLAGTDIEFTKRIRREMIHCTCEDIRKLAKNFRKALDEGNICAVGTEKDIDEDQALFKNVRTLFE